MTLSLETIREAASKSDSPEAIYDLFYKLIFIDQPLYLAVSGNTPAFSPNEMDPNHVYLRLFTHKELADRFVARRSNTTFVDVTAIECAKLARVALSSGVYGIVLNAGDKWVSISNTEFLDIFFNRILKEPELYNADYALLFNFLCEMRTSNRLKYGVEEENGVMEIQAGSGTPLMPDMLLNLTAERISIQRLGDEEEFTKKQLWDAMQMYGWPTPEVSPSIDIEQLIAWDKLPVEQFRLGPNRPQNQPIVINDNVQVEPMVATVGEGNPQKDPNNSQPEPEPTVEVEPSAPTTLQTAMLKVEDIAVRVWGTVRERYKKFPNPFKKKGGEMPVSEDKPDKPKEEKAILKGDILKKKPVLIMGAAAAALILIVVLVLLVQNGVRQHALAEFKGQIDERNYAAAYDIYEEKHLGKAADDYMRDNLNTLILQYAGNEITAEELMASLRSYSNFSSIEQDLLTAQMMASKLEISKNSYVEGSNTPDVYKRLDLWRQIIELDTVNYAAARQDVEAHTEEYIPALGERIEYYSTKSQEFALARYEVLAYWYPESAVTKEWGKTYESMRKTPLAYYPIEVTSLTMHQSPSGYWTLNINWDNVSAKQIAEVCFTFVAYDMNGNPVTCNDGSGKWTFFDGRDIGPYKPGSGPVSDQHGWEKAFYGSVISTVKITAIKVYYSSSQTPEIYTESVDLKSMYSKN